MNIKIYIEKKNIKREVDIGRNRYRNMSEKEKQKLRKSQKNYCNKKSINRKIFIFLVYSKKVKLSRFKFL